MLGDSPVSHYGDDESFAAQLAEVCSGGDLVSVVEGSDPVQVVRANAATGKPAHGFLLQAGSSGESREVHRTGRNNQVTGLAVGPLWLSDTVPGKTTSTAPSPVGGITQYIGEAVAATEFSFQPDIPIER